VEHGAPAEIHERLGRSALGEDHLVAVEFDVKVFEAVDGLALDVSGISAYETEASG
jgi:hypothetical protein